MELELDDKRALVTGSNAGIGEVIANILAAENAVIVVHGRYHQYDDRVSQIASP